MKRMMLWCVACALLAGCDYTVPLVKTPDAEIDTSVVGRWQRTGSDGKVESLLVLPLGKKEYLVAFPAGSEDAMYARGCIWRSGSLQLVQLNWFGTARGNLPDDNRTFQYASYAVAGDSITVRLLNPNVVSKDSSSSDALAKAIADNRDNPGLYRDSMVFQKAKK
jgi:hypothetical protein